MRFLFIISFIGFFVIGCKTTKSTIVKRNTHTFILFEIKDTINLQITYFAKNSAFCYTEVIPYALIIGQTDNPADAAIPKSITVLAMCDTNTYVVGQNIKVLPIANPETQSTLKPLYFTKDTIIKNQKYRWLLGSENPAIWGKVQ